MKNSHVLLGGLNDCATCQGGTSGANGITSNSCWNDQADCKSGAIPWNSFCSAVSGNSPWETAGQSGCSICGTFASVLQSLCPTTCNYCEDLTITTTTTTSTTSTTTTTENTRNFNFLLL